MTLPNELNHQPHITGAPAVAMGRAAVSALSIHCAWKVSRINDQGTDMSSMKDSVRKRYYIDFTTKLWPLTWETLF